MLKSYDNWKCSWCDAAFIPVNVVHCYCSRKCYKAAEYARAKAKKEAAAAGQGAGTT